MARSAFAAATSLGASAPASARTSRIFGSRRAARAQRSTASESARHGASGPVTPTSNSRGAAAVGGGRRTGSPAGRSAVSAASRSRTTGTTRAERSAAALSICARPGAVAPSVSSTLPSTGLRTRIETTTWPLSTASVPSTITRALAGTSMLAPTTTTSTPPSRSARATSVATA
jgi:hypothetical protein